MRVSGLRNYIIAVSALFFFAGQLLAQNGNNTVSVIDRDTILIGDQIKWSIRIPAEELEKTSGFMLPDKPGEIMRGVEILGGVTLDTLSLKNRVPEIEASVLITSFDSGSYQLPPFPIYLKRTDGTLDTLDMKAPKLEVLTIQVDTASFEPYDIKGQMTYPITFAEILPWILIVLGILLISYLVYRYVGYLRAKRAGKLSEVHKDPPHIIALRELDLLRGRKLWQEGKEKEYYTVITDILRAYLEARYSIQAMEKTSNEILEELSGKNMKPEQFQELSDLFSLSDLVKFAKYTASREENENAIPVAVRFVNSTFEEVLEEEKRG